MADCIFCRIVAGDIPSHRVYDDERVFAFLDINPLAEGHVLVVPKAHAERLDAVDAETVAAIGRVLPKLAAAVVRATGCQGYNILQNNGRCAGQEVGHVHFHIIPRESGDGLGYRWHPKQYAEGRDVEIRDKITQGLQS